MHRLTPARPISALALAAPLGLVAGTAFAHTGAGAVGGFLSGVSHPLFGADHLLAMVAVGLWAGLLGGGARWRIPASFVAVMLAGGALALGFAGLPLVELMIVGSVVALGALVALNVRVATAAGMAVVAAFALFHGYAHGLEMPATAAGLAYFSGFALATAALHALGLGIGVLAGRLDRAVAVRAAGGAIAAAGVLMVVGV